MTATPQTFADAALSFLGTRYHHQGRLPGVGLDCLGVPVCAAAAVGLDMVDETAYAALPVSGALRTLLEKSCEKAYDPSLKVGDILAMAWDSEPQHIAIVVSVGEFTDIVHAHIHARAVVRHRLDDTWLARVRGVYRLRGLV